MLHSAHEVQVFPILRTGRSDADGVICLGSNGADLACVLTPVQARQAAEEPVRQV